MSAIVKEAKGERVYVIGDIHGCVEEPRLLLEFLEREEGLNDNDVVIFLGDYIDRGPASNEVIDLMLGFHMRFPNTRFLKGNHEDMLLDFLGYGGQLGSAFLYNGGLETIQSYGISVFAPPQEIVEAMPKNHFKFYCELESMILVDNYICVHAGLNPLRDLYEQSEADIFWIREEFINNIHPFERTIVFGHTPHRDAMVHLPYKIGIDTGLVFGNKLSCLELKSGKVFSIGLASREVELSQIDFSN